MRTDPTDNGGLFVGRRPGTAPVRYRGTPEPGGATRRVVDALFAGSILFLMGLIAVCFWGPIPMAWLYIGAQVQYHTDSVSLALVVAFLGMILTLLAGLALLKRIDQFWILVRRAAGHDQRTGAIGAIFAVGTGVGVLLFVLWMLLLAGPGPGLDGR